MDLVTRLRARPDFRLTSQRRVVAEVLRGEHVHLTAEAVHERARQQLPEISLATVYNTLNELVALGEVLELAVGEGAKRYDPNVAIPHDHLRCVRCNELLDIGREPKRVPKLPDARAHGYEILDVEIVFQGLCPKCQQPPAARTRRERRTDRHG